MTTQKNVRPSADGIALLLMELEAWGHNFLAPIQWASGTFNPFYVDNRKLLSYVYGREYVRKTLGALLGINTYVDCIYGIPKAGIAPATLLALETKKDLIFKHTDGKYYRLDIKKALALVRRTITSTMRQVDLVAGTSPFGIIFGIILAEELKCSFLFVREEPKGHGLMKQVEGIQPKAGSKGILVDPICTGIKRYTKVAETALEQLGVEITSKWEHIFVQFVEEVTRFSGLSIVGQEDLVSTGGSGLDEIKILLEMGAVVHPQSIFSYELPQAKENFAKYGLVNNSCITFGELMTELMKAKKLSEIEEETLWAWYNDQPNWGDNNGYPRVK